MSEIGSPDGQHSSRDDEVSESGHKTSKRISSTSARSLKKRRRAAVPSQPNSDRKHSSSNISVPNLRSRSVKKLPSRSLPRPRPSELNMDDSYDEGEDSNAETKPAGIPLPPLIDERVDLGAIPGSMPGLSDPLAPNSNGHPQAQDGFPRSPTIPLNGHSESSQVKGANAKTPNSTKRVDRQGVVRQSEGKTTRRKSIPKSLEKPQEQASAKSSANRRPKSASGPDSGPDSGSRPALSDKAENRKASSKSSNSRANSSAKASGNRRRSKAYSRKSGTKRKRQSAAHRRPDAQIDEEQQLVQARKASRLFDNNEAGQAMIVVQEVLASDPAPDAHALTLSLQGYRFLVKNAPAKSLGALEEAVTLLPNCRRLTDFEKSDIFYRLADICEQLRNVLKGLEAIKACINILLELNDSARLRRALAAKGRLHYLVRHYEDACEAFENALLSEGPLPETWKLYHGIAKCYDKLERKDDAKKAYENSRRSLMVKARDRFAKMLTESGQEAPEDAARDPVELPPEPKTISPKAISQRLKSVELAKEQARKSSSVNLPAASNLDEPTKSDQATATLPQTPTVQPASPSLDKVKESIKKPISKSLRNPSGAVSEAYPRQQLLDLLGPQQDEHFDFPRSHSISNVSRPGAPKRPSSQDIPTQRLSSLPRAKLGRDTIIALLAGIPAILILFLLGLWFGHSGNNEAMDSLKEQNSKLENQVQELKQQAALERSTLGLALAEACLGADQSLEALKRSSQAFKDLKTLGQGESLRSHQERALNTARSAFLRGPWSWCSLNRDHRKAITSLQLSSDGYQALSVDEAGVHHLWCSLSGEILQSPKTLAGAWAKLAFAPERPTIGALNSKGQLSLRSLKNSNDSPQSLGETIRDFCFSADGSLCAALDRQHTVRIWNVDSAKVSGSALKHDLAVKSFCFFGDSPHLLSLDESRTLRLWDLSGRILHVIDRAHEQAITAFACDKDKQRAVSISSDGRARLWVLDKSGHRLSSDGEIWLDVKNVRCAALSRRRASGSLLALGCQDGRTVIYESSPSWAVKHTFKISGSSVSHLQFMPHAGGLLCASREGHVRLWRLPKHRPQRSVDKSAKAAQLFRSTPIKMVTSCQDPGFMLGGLGADGKVRLWTVEDTHIKPITSLGERARFVALSQDRRLLAYAREDQQLIIRDLFASKDLSELAFREDLTALAFLPGGDQFVVGDEQGRLRLFDVSGKQLQSFETEPSQVSGKVVSLVVDNSRGWILSVLQNGGVQLWKKGQDKALQQFLSGSSKTPQVAFSPDGSHIAVSTDKPSLKVWSVNSEKSFKQVLDESLKDPCQALAFSRDGSLIALADGRKVSVRSVKTAEVLMSWSYEEELRGLVMFSGPNLMSISSNGQIALWPLSGRGFSKRRFEKAPARYVERLTGMSLDK